MGRELIRIASANPHKAAELGRLVRAALGPLAEAVTVGDLAGVTGYPVVPEDATDYYANARRKAEVARDFFPDEVIVADDSGIEVAALGGAPGPLSNRWARGPLGEPLDAAGLNAALLARLAQVPPEGRGARMVCAAVLYLPGRDGGWAQGWGEVRGRIAYEAAGSGGFGYDAVFVLQDGRRLSEVPAEVKDAVGHRGHAVRAVAGALRSWLARRAGGSAR